MCLYPHHHQQPTSPTLHFRITHRSENLPHNRNQQLASHTPIPLHGEIYTLIGISPRFATTLRQRLIPNKPPPPQPRVNDIPKILFRCMMLEFALTRWMLLTVLLSTASSKTWAVAILSISSLLESKSMYRYAVTSNNGEGLGAKQQKGRSFGRLQRRGWRWSSERERKRSPVYERY